MFIPSPDKTHGYIDLKSIYLIDDNLSKNDRISLKDRFNELDLPEYQDTRVLGDNNENKDGVWFWWD